jgi:transporter family-2 protein
MMGAMTTTTRAQQVPTGSQVRGIALGVAAAFVIGVILACQSRLNGELGHRWGDGVIAALWSFGSGLVLLLGMLAVSPTVRGGVRQLVATVRGLAGETAELGGRRRRLHWWQCLGGVCGAFLVVIQSATVGLVGVAVFTVAVVAGQAGSSLVVDKFGLGPGSPRPVTGTRVVGAALALGAVILTVSDDLRTTSTVVLALLPAVAGIGLAWQQAVNGRVGAAAGAQQARRSGGTDVTGALVAVLVNFAVGTTALVVAAGIDIAIRGLPAAPPAEPLLYIGGLCGIVFISLAVVVVRVIGVLLLGLASVAGQLAGALVLDALAPATGAHLTVITVSGTLLTLVAIGIAAIPTRARGVAEVSRRL